MDLQLFHLRALQTIEELVRRLVVCQVNNVEVEHLKSLELWEVDVCEGAGLFIVIARVPIDVFTNGDRETRQCGHTP